MACVSSLLSQQSSSDELAGLHLVIIKDKQTDAATNEWDSFYSCEVDEGGGKIKTKCATLAMRVSACVCVCICLCMCGWVSAHGVTKHSCQKSDLLRHT